MASGVLLLLFLADLAIAQDRPASPPVMPLRSLPITDGPFTFVNPRSPCPPRKGGPVRVGSALVQPPLLAHTAPRLASSGACVLIEAIIQQDGTVGKMRVLRGAKHLHEPALEAVRRWKFARTCFDGVPIPLIHVVVVNFSGE